MVDYKLILSKHGISKTKFRTDLLNLFYTSKKSFLVEDILNFFCHSVNKVTIYRALDNFESKGLIHQVPDKDGLKKYALCNNKECSINSHSHQHGHFICHHCHQTFCLDEIKSPEITCLKGFYVKELRLILEGYCNECYKNN